MPSASRRSRVALGTGTAGAVLALSIWSCWSSPPAMGDDEEVAKSIDALFTAITAHDGKRLGDCEKRLLWFKESGQLPLPAADYLDHVIHNARAERWESAARSLYDFMRAQRRDAILERVAKDRRRSTSSRRT